MSYTLGTAARATGVSKSTIYRAIKGGRMSANRADTGDYAIDPAELHRVFPPAKSEDARAVTHASAKTAAGTAEGGELALKAARLEAEIAASALVAELLRRQLDETRADRDHWRGQAQRLVAPLPSPSHVSPMVDIDMSSDRSGFMSRLFGRA
jgi:excisionase family DNA binding protein